jgi:hypothetical protein
MKTIKKQLLVLLLMAGLVLGIVCYHEIGAWFFSGGLYSHNDETAGRDGRNLAAFGVPGRRAMLRAVREGDRTVGERARWLLASVLREDLRQGRSIEPIIREALDGMDLPGEAGARSAAVAVEGWDAGLLDEAAKRRLIRRWISVEICARTEYPAFDQPREKFRGDLSRIGSPWARFHASFFGQDFSCDFATADRRPYGPSQSSRGYFGKDTFLDFHNIRFALGEHTLYAKVKVHRNKWSMEVEAQPVTIKVVESVPAEYLQAKSSTPLDTQVRQSVILSPRKPGRDKSTNTTHLYKTTEAGAELYTHSVSFSAEDLPVVRVRQALPVDLAFRVRWQLTKPNTTGDAWCHPCRLEEGERKASGFFVVPKGKTDACRLWPSQELWEAINEPGEHNLAIRIRLEASLEAALNFPEVDAYWPGTIELPETTLRVFVKKADQSPANQPSL